MINKILKMLKESDDFVSGEYIANKLKVTRAVIWKYIVKLKKMGYEIDSVNNKGYFLKDCSKLYNEFEIPSNLKTKIFGKQCFYFDEIESTNVHANLLANKNFDEGTIIVADCQTKGKGRLEREWISEKNVGIYFSIILRPDIEIVKSTQITLLAGISLCNTLKQMNIPAKIKWPNDIVLNNKKIAGILTEINAEIEKTNYIILGIGINVNNKSIAEDINHKATSIFLEQKTELDRKIILQNFLYNFEIMYNEYMYNIDFSQFLEQYKNLCVNLGNYSKVIYKDKEIYGKIIDITDEGQLILLDDDNSHIKIVSGEVSIRNIDGKYI